MPRVILDYDKSYKKGTITSDYLDVIRAYFSIPNPNEKLMKAKYPGAHVEKRLHGITASGKFELGLYFNIMKYLSTADIDYEVVTTKPLREHVIIGYDTDKFKMPELSMPPRDFQESGVERGLAYGSGTFLVGTGGGKTLLMAFMDQALRQYNDNMIDLIAMPANLVLQTYKEFIEFGISEDDISLWSAGNEFEIKPIIIASYQTMAANLTSFKKIKPKPKKEKEDLEVYEAYVNELQEKEKARMKVWKKRKNQILKQLTEIQTVQMDEVHSLRKGNNLNKVLHMLSAKHRYGYTGTMPEGKLDEWNIIGKIGPVLEDVSSYELRERGYLSPVNAQIIQIHYKNPIITKPDRNEPTKAYNEESEWVFNNEYRNKLISKLCGNFENNSLIVVDKLAHGNILYETLQRDYPEKQVYWICGAVSMNVREEIRELMERQDQVICIAMSKCFSQGINIKNLHFVIFAQGGKAKIRLVQSIGRGLRLHETKERLVILDISDDLRYGSDHLIKRMSRYDSEKIQYNIKDIYEP